MKIRLPFRFKLVVISLIGFVILGAGAIVLFSRAWVDLSRAYGLLSINRRLESTTSLSQGFEDGEWAVHYSTPADTALRTDWLKKPDGMDPAKADELAERVFKSLVETRLNAGSFEIAPDPSKPGETYFVAFREMDGGRTAAATRAHRSLWDLSPWAAPFLLFFIVAIAVSTALFFALTGRLTRAYTLLGKAMRDVGAGRMENLELPDDSDESIRGLADSLREMAGLLARKEQKIAEVSQLADEDAMTGMKNYRAFSNYMKEIFGKGSKANDTFPVLAIVDLDFFKKVNDNYGHQVGDFVLRSTSQIIKQSIRMQPTPGRIPDFCGRYGGEEFVVIFAECQTRSAHLGALRLLKAIKTQKLVIPDDINEKGMPKEMSVSASIGIAPWIPGRFASKEEWIKEADAALYEAKHRGRARLVRMNPELQEWV